MDEDTILSQLEELAQRLKIEVRYEPIRKESSYYPGGLCLLKGEYVLIINSNANKSDKMQTLAKAVKHFDLSHVYLRPGLRDFLETLHE